MELKEIQEYVKKQLSEIDTYMKTSVEYGKGIRILNQDLWETIISFIISANNNIPRIKGIIEKLSKTYGNEIIWNNNKYYTFPSVNQLKDVTIEQYRKLGLGFRDIRLYETTQMILNKEIDLEYLKEEKDTLKVREELLKLSGVGPKVADCILLFSELKRFDVFPIDVWVRRVMNDLYIKEENEEKVSKKKIENLVFFVVILIITIVIINYVWNGNKKSDKAITNTAGRQLANADTTQTEENNNLEERLENILGKIQGVGTVKVFINYSESSQTVAMYNENSKTSTTEETDTSGGTRKVEQTDSDKEIVYQEENGKKTPILQKTLQPKIEGAIITAKGASNVNVKTNIIQAVEAATGLATHKIQVFEMN